MDLDKLIKTTGLKIGVVLGITLLAVNIFSFYFLISHTKEPLVFVIGPTVISFLLPVLLVIVLCYYFRKQIGGYWTFRQAATGIFIMFIVAYLIQALGRDVVFAKFIEPNMVEKTYVAYKDAAVEMKKNPKVDKIKIDQNIEEMKKNLNEQDNITVGKVISGTGINIVLVFFMALIFAVLFKKENPNRPVAIQPIS